jgi:hypothetical protein
MRGKSKENGKTAKGKAVKLKGNRRTEDRVNRRTTEEKVIG